LKRLLLLSAVFLTTFSTRAANFYWVGGTGKWSDAKHWSASSGGPAGSAIPGMNDDVYFDQHSFTADKQTVMVTSPAACRNLDWSAIDKKAMFSAAPSRSIVVYGSYKLSPLLYNGFLGRTIFASPSAGNMIYTEAAPLSATGNSTGPAPGFWAMT
jgi:hypothetical protein